MAGPTPIQRYAYRHFLAHLETLTPEEKAYFLDRLDPGLFQLPEAAFFEALDQTKSSFSERLPPRRILIWVSTLVLVGIAVWMWVVHDGTGKARQSPENLKAFHNPWGMPSTENVIHRQAYSFVFDLPTKTAVWISYRVQSSGSRFKHADAFDPAFPGRQRNPDAYEDTPYEKGSLITPSHVRGAIDPEETQYYSVTAPITQRLRASVLASVRRQTAKKGASGPVWVTTGPVFDGSQRPLLDDAPIPSHYFYLVAMDPGEDKPTTWAFIFPNEPDIPNTHFANFLVSVDRVEQRTGLDFFNQLPATIQQALESHPGESPW